ncbi:hypothetical protein OAK65_03115 [Synechococcus sp. AH-551-N17]|nr:hypothetical protein [Synechococcus sp. AH-551-N17]
MDIAVLFWFYKNIPVCVERLERFRRINPRLKVFALYGGDRMESDNAFFAINHLVDDFYSFDEQQEPQWKWRNGDHLIGSWFLKRGVSLQWESIFIMQWDMLVLKDPLEVVLKNLQSEQVLLSGFTGFENVSEWWGWSKNYPDEVQEFKNYLLDKFKYSGSLYACLFIVVCLPRGFLAKYSSLAITELGFLEYKVPTMAKVFGFEICYDSQFDPWWAANPATVDIARRDKVLNASRTDIGLMTIFNELMAPSGRRIFHPYGRSLPGFLENKLLMKLVLFLLRIPKIVLTYVYHYLNALQLGLRR